MNDIHYNPSYYTTLNHNIHAITIITIAPTNTSVSIIRIIPSLIEGTGTSVRHVPRIHISLLLLHAIVHRHLPRRPVHPHATSQPLPSPTHSPPSDTAPAASSPSPADTAHASAAGTAARPPRTSPIIPLSFLYLIQIGRTLSAHRVEVTIRNVE